MARALYLNDAYLREFDTVVEEVLDDGVGLRETAFYPAGGGQPSDRGVLTAGPDQRWTVTNVAKAGEKILHRVEGPPPAAGTAVHGSVDWELRFAHMRYHTCLHILSGVVFRRFGSVITGNQIYPDRARMDLNLPEFGPQTVAAVVEEVNAVVREAHPVKVRFLPRAEAERDPTLVRVARELVPDVEEVRLIDIEGFDVQADGGTHVANTREVGTVRLLRTENKGAKNKRLYVAADPPA